MSSGQWGTYASVAAIETAQPRRAAHEQPTEDVQDVRSKSVHHRTKEATKTTELIAYVVAVVGVGITTLTVDDNPDFGAERAWLYITILTVGYMVSRGLAKAGSHEPYDENNG